MKTINSIEKQLLAYQNDDSEETRLKIQELKNSLSDEKDNLKEGMNIRVKINLHNVQHEIVRKLLEDKQQMLYLLKKKHEYISVEYAL